MKFLFSFFICIIVFSFFAAHGKELSSNYTVSVKGVKIGELDWNLSIKNNKYNNKIILKNKGIFSYIYKFSGEYFAGGIVEDGIFFSKNYSHNWITKKRSKVMKIFFINNNVGELNQKPIENEVARVNIYTLEDYSDPITSFINIFNNQKSSDTIDGRRIYTMVASQDVNDVEKTTINIKNYKNIWADHKRNDLEKIIFIKDHGLILPNTINIYFKGDIFKVYKN